MSRPLISFLTIDHGAEGWDDAIVANFALIASVFGGPIPIGPEYGSTNALPDPALFEACLGVALDATGWQLVLSDGTDFHVIGRQCDEQPDSEAESLTDLRAEFNGLLAKFRASGLMAAS